MRLFFICLAFWSLPAWADEPLAQISMQGEGSVEMAPDMAIITLGAVREAVAAADALDATNRATAAVLARLAAAGVAERDMQTSGLSLSPRWENPRSMDNGRPRIGGFVATNMVTVRVRDLSILGVVLDAAVADGANQFHGLSFGMQEPRPLQDEARRRAVADARAKAELYAGAAGVKLGRILSITEAGGGAPGPVMMREMAVSSPVPVAPGEVSIAQHVNITWQIE
ncbi:MAG: SIMPL domain-containing protein [Rhodobacteraceae bacterium]|nr:SIMPL domain-containing protein [Paracoccaceae bacterium]